MKMHYRLLLGLASITIAGSLAACGGDNSDDTAAPAAAPTTAAATSAAPSAAASSAAASGTLTIADTTLGKVVADGQGYVLYLFDKDTATTSACVDQCAVNWPPVGPATAASGVTLPGAITTITRPDGTSQVAYAGHPLYRWIKDTAPGQTTGEGVQGVWHVIKVA